MKNKKVLLVILDGWGQGDGSSADIISQANVPLLKICIIPRHIPFFEPQGRMLVCRKARWAIRK
jgi:bisphosphoglycerate-independent phosphoglycerate mutase (AlkP superfamily)